MVRCVISAKVSWHRLCDCHGLRKDVKLTPADPQLNSREKKTDTWISGSDHLDPGWQSSCVLLALPPPFFGVIKTTCQQSLAVVERSRHCSPPSYINTQFLVWLVLTSPFSLLNPVLQ